MASNISFENSILADLNWRSIHLYASIISVILFAIHVIYYAKRYIKGKSFYAISVIAIISALASIFVLPYLERWCHKVNIEKNNNLQRKFTPNYQIKIIKRNNGNNQSKKRIKFNNIIKSSKDTIQDNNIDDSFRDELNIIISGVSNYNTEKKKNIHDKPKTIDNFKGKKNIDNFEQNNIDFTDDINIDINIENINDESEEKSIPKENEEKINLMKQYKRPITSYAYSKT